MFVRTMTALVICVLTAMTAMSADQDNPYAQPEETWISLSGTIASPRDDSFLLDLGEGIVVVEMDDWDPMGEAAGLQDGDKAIVFGKVDDDLYEATTIEAESLDVENRKTYLRANSADEEGDPATRTFTISKGGTWLEVDTWELGYNPLDDHGSQKIDPGDVVSVIGPVDTDFFGKRELEAESVVTLEDGDDNS